jgi:DNA invertase Pin-like site-specific DNA recombinase
VNDDPKLHMIGYARVSMSDQSPQLQIDALLAAGVDRRDIYEEQASGSGVKRPEFDAMLKDARAGDIVVIWKLDRLGRSVRQVLSTFDYLARKGVAVRVITQPGMDTSTAMGRLIVTIMAAVAEMEKDLINERTAAGLKAARAVGRIGGRKEQYTDAQISEVMHLGSAKGAAALGMSKTQFIRRVDKLRKKEKANG